MERVGIRVLYPIHCSPANKKPDPLFQARHHITPSSRLGQALTCLFNQWKPLMEPFRDGRLDIDNNGVENAIRPSAVGKKNPAKAGFIGTKAAGRKSTIPPPAGKPLLADHQLPQSRRGAARVHQVPHRDPPHADQPADQRRHSGGLRQAGRTAVHPESVVDVAVRHPATSTENPAS